MKPELKDTALAVGFGIVGAACALAVIAEVPLAAAGAGALVLASAAAKRVLKEEDPKEETNGEN